MQILIIRTKIDQERASLDFDVKWSGLEEGEADVKGEHVFSTSCPNCLESLVINVLVNYGNETEKEVPREVEIKQEVEQEQEELVEELEPELVQEEEYVVETIEAEEVPETFDVIGHEYEEEERIEEIFEEEMSPRVDRSSTIIEDSDLAFLCDVCGMKFNSLFSCRIHKNIHTDKFLCRICSARFIKGERLKNHLKRHTPAEQELARHLEMEATVQNAEVDKKSLSLTSERGTLCPHCGKIFSTPASLLAHTQNAHKSHLFECDYCGKVLRSRKTFKHHLFRTHNDKMEQSEIHRCNFCHAPFLLKRDLHIHLRTKHVPKEKTLVCEICSDAFIYKRELLEHLRCHQEKTEGRYKCSYCERTFNRLSRKRDHETIHTEDRHYPCSFCGQKYKRKSYMIIHERIHTGYRPFECKREDCHAKFYDRGSLRQHRLRHEKKDKGHFIKSE